MCSFFSFNIDRQGNVYALLGKNRAEAILKKENPDSHTYIAEVFGIDEDQCWKYELPLDLDELKKKVQSGDLSDFITVRRIVYDGGLPETELKASHENAIRSFLSSIDWKRDIIEPMEDPVGAFDEIVKIIKSDETGRWAYLLPWERAERIIGIWFLGLKEDRKVDRQEHWGQLQLQLHNTALIEDKCFFAVTKRKYYDNRTNELKMKVRIVISGFEDLTVQQEV